ncbi:MAG: hypothetical protein HYZ42_00570 [Bacteroidetes bacterium]|nr:hypothetical protein [Bacteroidota bacterium]
MKSRQSVAIMIIILLLLIGVGIYLYLTQSKTKYNWNENFDRKSEEPFDLKYTYELLKNKTTDKKFHEVATDLHTHFNKYDSIRQSNFVYIGDYYNVDDSNANLLLDYIRRGNNVYIATKDKPYGLISNLFCRDLLNEQSNYLSQQPVNEDGYAQPYEEQNQESYEGGNEYTTEQPYPTTYGYDKKSLYDLLQYMPARNDSVNLKFNYAPFNIGKGFHFRYFYLYDYENYFWGTIDTAGLNNFGLCDTLSEISYDVLGSVNNKEPGFIRINIGKGSLYLHSNPLVFTNYFMVEKQGYDYASRYFSYLKPGDVFWETKKDRSYNKYVPEKPTNHSPLKFFLAQPSLRWAWYTLLVLAIVFVIFWSKRKQRAVPVLPIKSNDSLEYYSMVSRLYFLNQNHHNLSRLMQRHFGLFVRKKFLINIHDHPEKAIQILGNKTQLGEEFIKSIFDQFSYLDKYNEISESDLIELYIKLQKFYKSCK